ncbi:SDR family oxidoreductase [Candidatus Pelagibacter sp.]|nr:SDR family oxidoreductase [Candidatus Pelagibacter sp.]
MKINFKYNLDFTNQNILITGGFGFIGTEISLAYLNLGAKVIVVDKNINKIPKSIMKYKNKLIIKKCDLSKHTQRKKLINNLKSEIKKIDCLINNASYDKKNLIKPMKKQSVEIFKKSLDVNLIAPFHLSKEISKLMKNSKDPNIINISSIYSFIAPDFDLYKDTKMGNAAAYSSAKSGINQLSTWFSSALSPKIRVNSISLGGLLRKQPQNFINRYKKKTLLKRMANLEDVVGPIIFLSSNLARYITGHNLVVDGGYTKN